MALSSPFPPTKLINSTEFPSFSPHCKSMAKNTDCSPFLFSSTFVSHPLESEPSSSSSSPPPSFGSSQSDSSFNSPYTSSPTPLSPPISDSYSGHFPAANFGPCAACESHDRRCSDKCYVASFIPPTVVPHLAVVDSFFGSGSVVDFLQNNSNTLYTPLLLLLGDTRQEDEVESHPKNNDINNHKQLVEPVNPDPVSKPIQLRELAEQLKFWQREAAVLRQNLNNLQEGHRKLMGEQLNGLSIKDLQGLEYNLETSLRVIRNKKSQMLIHEIQELSLKERQIHLENIEIYNKLNIIREENTKKLQDEAQSSCI